MKCAWTHCKYNKNITDGQETVKIGNRNYHKECACEKENINNCITLFIEQINEQIVISKLRSIINTLIYKQGYSSEYVLYSIKYCINHPEVKLTYPEGLHRVCKDLNIQKLYKNMKATQQLQGQKVEIDNIEEHNFEHKVTNKKKLISDLFN